MFVELPILAGDIIARLPVRVLPAPPRSPAQIPFPGAVEIVFNIPRLCRRTRGIARSLPPGIGPVTPKMPTPVSGFAQLFPGTNWRRSERLVRLSPEMGSSLARAIQDRHRRSRPPAFLKGRIDTSSHNENRGAPKVAPPYAPPPPAHRCLLSSPAAAAYACLPCSWPQTRRRAPLVGRTQISGGIG
jgi:hypothetical protein